MICMCHRSCRLSYGPHPATWGRWCLQITTLLVSALSIYYINWEWVIYPSADLSDDRGYPASPSSRQAPIGCRALKTVKVASKLNKSNKKHRQNFFFFFQKRPPLGDFHHLMNERPCQLSEFQLSKIRVQNVMRAAGTKSLRSQWYRRIPIPTRWRKTTDSFIW